MLRQFVHLTVTTMAALAGFAVVPLAATAADLYVAPGGSGSACSSAQPCGSFEAAYRAASPGQVIEVRGGSYPHQVVPSLGRPAPAIELRSAAGASVVASGIDVRADHVVVRDMRSTGGLDLDGPPSDPIEHVRFFNMHGKSHWINNARDFVWTGGSIGPTFNTKASMVGGQPASRQLTYDGILWHDATRDDQSVHMECFYVASVQGLTIRNSRFTNCAVYDLFITRIAPDPNPTDIVLENNVFEESKDINGRPGFYAIGIHGDVRLNSLVLRNNVLGQWFQYDSPSLQGGRMVGNIVATGWSGASCHPALSFSHNVFTKGRCSGTDTVAAQAFSQFQDPSRGDWRLTAGAAAIDAGDPQDTPALDAFGDVRPWGRAPDAGVHEYGSRPPGGAGATPGPQQPGTGAAKRRKARVLRVVSGRKLRVRMKGGRKRTVRLLGVKLPRAGCGGRVAAARLRALAPKGKFVIVLTDRNVRARGRKASLPAYVIRERRDLGRVMIARGWARLARHDHAMTRIAGYRASQGKAKRDRRGLWRCS